jgi:hypothetical protein
MATPKLTKFQTLPARILRFNLNGKAIPISREQLHFDNRDKIIVGSVLPLSVQSFSPGELAVLAAAFVEKGWAKA